MTTNCSWSSRLTSILARPFVLWGFAALATSLTVQWIFKHEELHSPARQMFGFLPAVMAGFFFFCFLTAVPEVGVVKKRIQLQAAPMALLFSLSLSSLFLAH